MEIHKDNQYNQGIGKFKFLSSNAGVGSIETTKAGFFIIFDVTFCLSYAFINVMN